MEAVMKIIHKFHHHLFFGLKIMHQHTRVDTHAIRYSGKGSPLEPFLFHDLVKMIQNFRFPYI